MDGKPSLPAQESCLPCFSSGQGPGCLVPWPLSLDVTAGRGVLPTSDGQRVSGPLAHWERRQKTARQPVARPKANLTLERDMPSICCLIANPTWNPHLAAGGGLAAIPTAGQGHYRLDWLRSLLCKPPGGQ